MIEKNIGEGFTPEELALIQADPITSMVNNGSTIKYYQGDEPVPPQPGPPGPNWRQLTLDLFASPLYQKALIEAQPNAYSTLLKVLTDGEKGLSSENTFLNVYNMLHVGYDANELAEFNQILLNNNFTITVS